MLISLEGNITSTIKGLWSCPRWDCHSGSLIFKKRGLLYNTAKFVHKLFPRVSCWNTSFSLSPAPANTEPCGSDIRYGGELIKPSHSGRPGRWKLLIFSVMTGYLKSTVTGTFYVHTLMQTGILLITDGFNTRGAARPHYCQTRPASNLHTNRTHKHAFETALPPGHFPALTLCVRVYLSASFSGLNFR